MTVITLEQIPAQKVVSYQMKGSYALIPEMISTVKHFLKMNNVASVGAPLFICPELTSEKSRTLQVNNDVSLEICLPIDSDVSSTEQFALYELPACVVAKATHLGSYESLEKTYAAINALIEERNLVVDGAVREVYLNDPSEVATEDLKTEILVPVRRR